MKILLTGASSFTGYWFLEHLVAAGHEVVATFRGARDSYRGVRGRRVELAASRCRGEFDCAFGGDAFLRLAAEGGFDALCHHAAEVQGYKSADFDFTAALARNTHRVGAVLEALAAGGCARLVATGTVFEPDEGAGERPRRAFSPYGLSKALTWQTLRFFAGQHGLRAGKFVIANPFGPLEEPRFTAYLVRTWAAGQTAVVATPAYLRDNIHVALLAKAYARFVSEPWPATGEARLGPCGYVETQGAFAERFAAAMRPRLGLACRLELAQQTEFAEPRMRTNTDIVDAAALGFDEGAAWDALAAYYRASIEDGST